MSSSPILTSYLVTFHHWRIDWEALFTTVTLKPSWLQVVSSISTAASAYLNGVGNVSSASASPDYRVRASGQCDMLFVRTLVSIPHRIANRMSNRLFSIVPLSDRSQATMSFGAGASPKQSNLTHQTRSEFLVHSHTSEECTKSLCHFDRRFVYGEWPIKEIVGLGMSGQNCIRTSIL